MSFSTNSEWTREGLTLQLACIHLHFSPSEDGSTSLLASDCSTNITEVRSIELVDEDNGENDILSSFFSSDDISTTGGIKSVLPSVTSELSSLSVLNLNNEMKGK